MTQTRTNNSQAPAPAGSWWGVAYAALVYACFQAVFTYFVLFLNGLWVPKGVDDGTSRGFGVALAINTALVVLWGLQHSVMARRSFKQRWTKLIPAHTERATYCLAASIMLASVMLFWAPTPGAVWAVETPWLQVALYALGGLGWVLLLAASFEIDHFELFGVKQPLTALRGRSTPEPEFQARRIYRFVRHPIQTGVLLGMWLTPSMSVSHLMFASLMTAYIVVGLYFEERDLVRRFGQRYLSYRRQVPQLLPVRTPTAEVRPPAEPQPAPVRVG